MTDNQTSIEDVKTTNPQETVTETTVNHDTSTADTGIDYKVKFSESAKEAHRLLEESRAKDAEIAELRKIADKSANYGNNPEPLYPGFEELDETAKANLLVFTDTLKQNTIAEVYKDPAIAHAKKTYNETIWNNAFESVASKYPDLRESKEDFKSKYYREDNVPSNIDNILGDLAKVYLFDKAADIGAQRVKEQEDRIDVERAKGGDKQPTATRSLEDWNRLAQSNPAEFAKHSKEYNSDLASGKLK
jgi:hypothetical protein